MSEIGGPTVETLHTRLTALEGFVHEELAPKLDRNTEMTATIHAQSDEMYTAFIAAKNGLRVISAVGDGLVKASDIIEKRPKTLLVAAIATGTMYGFLTSGKAPEWWSNLLHLLMS